MSFIHSPVVQNALYFSICGIQILEPLGQFVPAAEVALQETASLQLTELPGAEESQEEQGVWNIAAFSDQLVRGKRIVSQTALVIDINYSVSRLIDDGL